ncbi:hypothetical protein FJT64_012042 [Amphibalanus amphitrite]|uniref:G-protein coupled receptors family 1 profile domain-containing protein n=1 Tax=Amphibalanus amphitrite TaxID=1232801 RepID=A0A6A4VER1_AMPAM|nr:hypothetical protein FJT64_012042 [Amphibalanus amphitrite]
MASSAGLDDGLSSRCLLRTPQLRCQRLAVSTAAGANTSRLVCAASDGQERATDMYAALVALSVLIVPVAALLNLAVVVTVYMNRRLHTVINVLVTVLCMNNVMWTGLFKNPVSWVSAAVVAVEYISGLLVIAVCYLRILIKIVQSKRRLRRRRDAALARTQQRVPISVSGHHSQPESSDERSGAGQQRAVTKLENVMRMIRHYNAAKSVVPLPADPCSSRSGTNPGRGSGVPPAERPEPHGQPAVSSPSAARRAGDKPAARVDIVATVSMTAFIMIFFVVISPLWTLGLVNDSSECVILPTMRIFLYIILIVTGGSAAIVSPFVLVLFSVDFRRALRDTFGKLMSR